MKILTIQGSPHKQGNTATVLEAFETMAAPDHEIDHVEITDYQVNGCLGCTVCQKNDHDPSCAQHDDAMHIFGKIIASDVVVYATPLYCWSFSAQLKALLDRHFCLLKGILTDQFHSLIKGKRIALLVTCGGSEQDNADLIQQTFDRIVTFSQCESMGKYIVPYCTAPETLGTKAQETAQKMIQDLKQLPVFK